MPRIRISIAVICGSKRQRLQCFAQATSEVDIEASQNCVSIRAESKQLFKMVIYDELVLTIEIILVRYDAEDLFLRGEWQPCDRFS